MGEGNGHKRACVSGMAPGRSALSAGSCRHILQQEICHSANFIFDSYQVTAKLNIPNLHPKACALIPPATTLHQCQRHMVSRQQLTGAITIWQQPSRQRSVSPEPLPFGISASVVRVLIAILLPKSDGVIAAAVAAHLSPSAASHWLPQWQPQQRQRRRRRQRLPRLLQPMVLLPGLPLEQMLLGRRPWRQRPCWRLQRRRRLPLRRHPGPPTA